GPGKKNAQDARTEIGGHPDGVPHVCQLRLPVFGYRAAEVVHGRDTAYGQTRVDDPLAELLAALRRPVQREAVRPLRFDLDPLVSEAFCALQQLLQDQRVTTVPQIQIRVYIEGSILFSEHVD